MDDNANNLADVPELASTPAPEQAQDDIEQPESDQSDSPDLDTDGVDPEFEEVDIDGEKVSLPKSTAEKARAALLRQADYTRKTQELATQREQFQGHAAQEVARLQSERDNIQSRARVYAIDERLQQYASVDWQALNQSDPVQAQSARFAYDELKDNRSRLVNEIQQQEAQKALQERDTSSRSMQQAQEVLAREIKGWSPQYAQDLRAVAKGLGADERELEGIKSSWIVRALHSHKVLQEMTAKAAKAPAPPAATPVRAITGVRATATKDPDKMSTSEWMDYERKRVAKLGSRR